tara:strand:+ start:518 stop:832 length:315 start_codon:yes stop_codon:yes gene_type:complete
MAKNRFIYAAVSATDANAIPVDNILGMEAGSADAESLVIYHQGFDDQDNNGQIDLEITAGSVKDVCRAIVEAINFTTDPFVVLGDDVNSVYLHPAIEDVTSTTN